LSSKVMFATIGQNFGYRKKMGGGRGELPKKKNFKKKEGPRLFLGGKREYSWKKKEVDLSICGNSTGDEEEKKEDSPIMSERSLTTQRRRIQ